MNAIPRINQEKEDRCENGKPLIIIRFRDEHVAQRYKARVAHVVKDAMQQAPDNYSSDLGDDIDLELHIWPKDVDASGSDTHGLFVTEPNDRGFGIPSYSQIFPLLSDNVEKLQNYISSAPRGRRCFNCNGSHIVRDCPLPRNYRAIDERRKAVPASVGRYHVEDGQQYGHLLPGGIRRNLRDAYGRRDLGYPPGWFEEAKIFPLLSDNVEKPPNYISSAPRGRRCFNCNGSHIVRDCPLPRNYRDIDERRKAVPASVGRYHVEDGQRYGHLLPGGIRRNLRDAYGRRELGYPPGWCEEAKIFPLLSDNVEKLQNYISSAPRERRCFNGNGSHIVRDCPLPRNYRDIDEWRKAVPASVGRCHVEDGQRYGHLLPGGIPRNLRVVYGRREQGWLEEAKEDHLYGCPPMSEQHSKSAMLQAPNATQAYKRRKLTPTPRASPSQLSLDEGCADVVNAYKRRKLTGTPRASPKQLSLDDAHADMVRAYKRRKLRRTPRASPTKLSMVEAHADMMNAYKRKLTLTPSGSPTQLLMHDARADMDLDDGSCSCFSY